LKYCFSLWSLCLCGEAFSRAKSTAVARAFIAVVVSHLPSWIDIVRTMPSDYFPEKNVNAVTGMYGVRASIGIMLRDPIQRVQERGVI